MKLETFTQIKKELTNFYILIHSLNEYLCRDNLFPHYILMEVLLQNAAHDSSDCAGYSHDEEVKRLKEIITKLKELASYHKSYYEKYIADEVDCIYMGYWMSEEEKVQPCKSCFDIVTSNYSTYLE